MDKWKAEETEKEIVVRIPKEKNYTIKDLKQKLINDLYNANNLANCKEKIELLDVILRNTI